MNLKEFRLSHNLTLKEVSRLINIPLRTYFRYEKDEKYGNSLLREKIENRLEEKFLINENFGVLTVDIIKETVAKVLGEYKEKVNFAYLFGSYAKGYAKGKSDVDILISTDITGLEFIGIGQQLREALHKKVDLIRLKDLSEGLDLLNEVMKDGIKIYG